MAKGCAKKCTRSRCMGRRSRAEWVQVSIPQERASSRGGRFYAPKQVPKRRPVSGALPPPPPVKKALPLFGQPLLMVLPQSFDAGPEPFPVLHSRRLYLGPYRLQPLARHITIVGATENILHLFH